MTAGKSQPAMPVPDGRIKWRWTLIGLVVAGAYAVSGIVSEFHPVVVFQELDVFFQLLQEMWPASRERWVHLMTDYLPRLQTPFIQTIQMAILGTVAGGVLAIPMIILASDNLMKNKAVYTVAK